MRQICYNKHNISLHFLSPYTRVVMRQFNFVFINTVTKRSIVLKGQRKAFQDFHDALLKGSSEDELTQILSSYGLSREILVILMQEGIVV